MKHIKDRTTIRPKTDLSFCGFVICLGSEAEVELFKAAVPELESLHVFMKLYDNAAKARKHEGITFYGWHGLMDSLQPANCIGCLASFDDADKYFEAAELAEKHGLKLYAEEYAHMTVDEELPQEVQNA